MPVHVIGPSRIRLLAVWDMNVRGKGHDSARALGSCRASLSHYGEFLDGDADLTVISGDFNNSVRWDTPEKESKFGDFMDDLESRGFASAYHIKRGCGRGEEPEHTLWWRKNVDAKYHIDYTFVRPGDAIQDVTIGKHEDCLQREFALAVVEKVFKRGPKQVDDHYVVVTLNTEPMDVWDADYLKAEMLIKQSSDFKRLKRP
jgi:hypothetical protein